MRRWLVAVLLLELGCGYALVGTGSVLPPEIRSVAVPAFENGTDRPGIEQRLSEAVAREMSGRGGLSVPGEADDADAVLRGRVDSYTAWPAVIDESGRTTEYQLVVVSTVKLVSTATNETILSLDNYRFQERYEVAATVAGYSDLENLAVDELASRFAESLVTALLEGF